MSVLLVILPGAPKVSKEIAENDREINSEIQNCTKDLIKLLGMTNPQVILRMLIDNDKKIKKIINGLPFSDQLYFKFHIIKEVCNKYNDVC
ncbi:hypothetical protein CDAR_267151 [Caerostris darwini]|uniref:Protein serine/threonine phosphatase 2C C-terminal domain-containing protein n=1 Tax=Caerostris darwini TaxID=1538125 RepID=A0AAV4TJK1_9ARAC|nr:hypothetical protein CDAR_267151 [Caerostris darwini]